MATRQLISTTTDTPDGYTPELSSDVASSTIKRLGLGRRGVKHGMTRPKRCSYDFFCRRIAVEVSLGPGPGGSPLGLAMEDDEDQKRKGSIFTQVDFIVAEQKGDARPRRVSLIDREKYGTCNWDILDSSLHLLVCEGVLDWVISHSYLLRSHKYTTFRCACKVSLSLNRPVVLSHRLIILDTNPHSP